jgi:hypothetical protein
LFFVLFQKAHIFLKHGDPMSDPVIFSEKRRKKGH